MQGLWEASPAESDFIYMTFLKGLIHAEKLHIKLITDVAESEQIHYLQQQKVPVICYGKGYTEAQAFTHIFKFIKNYLIKEQPDIFWEPNNLIPIKLYGFSGKIVLTVHDLFPITNPEYFSLLYCLYFSTRNQTVNSSR